MPRTLLLAALTALALTAPAGASTPPPGLGLDVTAADPAARTVTGVVHCTTPERAGKTESFQVAPDVPYDTLKPGARVGIDVVDGTVVKLVELPCDPPKAGGPGPGGKPGGPGGKPGGPGAGPGRGPAPGDRPGADAEGDAPAFRPGFLNRVWKFDVAVDGYAAGKLSVTLEKVLNLPKRFATQDDELVDQDAIVLVGAATKVVRDGERVGKEELAGADDARVQGKLLPAAKWQQDEDGEPVPTIRAKRITLG